MKINSINLSRLNNGQFYQFIENITTISIAEPVVSTILQNLQGDLAPMQLSFKKENFNAETEKIIAADIKRDRAISRINLLLKAASINDLQPNQIDVSNKLLLIIKSYGGGDIVSYNFNKETANLTNLVNNLLDKPAEIELLGIETDINFLKTCNQDFQTLYKNRGDAISDLKNVIPFYKLRKTVDAHYKDFIQITESMPKINPTINAQIENLINRFNVEIEKFKRLIHTKKDPVTIVNKPIL